MRDNPLHRIEIREMEDEELDLFLQQIRDRRLEPIRVYEEMQALKNRLIASKLTAKLDKMLLMLEKELAAADKALAKVEKRTLSIKAMKLELEEFGDEKERDSREADEGEPSSQLDERDPVHLRREQGNDAEPTGDGASVRSDGEHPSPVRTGGGGAETDGSQGRKENGSGRGEHSGGRGVKTYRCGKCGAEVVSRFAACIRC